MLERNLETRFHDEVLALCRTLRQECGYHATRVLAMTSEAGGVRAAKALLRADRFSSGFVAITLAGRPDLTLEALVLRDPWHTLFDEAELAVARGRLAECRHAAPRHATVFPAAAESLP